MSDKALTNPGFSGGQEPLGGGSFARVYAVSGVRGCVVHKVARPEMLIAAPGGTGAEFASGVYGFSTGAVGRVVADPAEVLADEARVLGRVRHGAMVRLLSQGTTPEGLSYLELEYVEGQTWRAALMQPGRLGYAHYLALLDALVTMHQDRSLAYHGDIKPENLMLTPAGSVRILDPACGSERRNGGVVTQLLATELYNPWFQPSDISALGILLAEVLTGVQLFVRAQCQGEQRSCRDGLKRVLASVGAMGRGRNNTLVSRMPLPTEIAPGFSRELETVVLKCLGLACRDGVLDVEPQFASVAQLRAALPAR